MSEREKEIRAIYGDAHGGYSNVIIDLLSIIDQLRAQLEAKEQEIREKIKYHFEQQRVEQMQRDRATTDERYKLIKQHCEEYMGISRSDAMWLFDLIDRIKYLKTTDVIEEIKDLKAELANLRNAKCDTCGRALSMDGDCYGCETDRLNRHLASAKQEIAGLREGMKEIKGNLIPAFSEIRKAQGIYTAEEVLMINKQAISYVGKALCLAYKTTDETCTGYAKGKEC